MGMERGTIGRIPYLATGSGPPMVFVGGLSFSGGIDAAGTEKMAASMVKPLASKRRVLFVNRRRWMPRGMTMAEIAAEHAEAIRVLGEGPVDVAGISTGGSIVQQMAADHPDVVDRLLLLCTACRLGPEGRRLQRRVAARVRAGALRQALALTMTGIVPPGRGQVPAAAVAWLAGPRALAGGDDLSDMATTIEAEDEFDLAACRSPIRAPTVILAGSEDRWYTPELFAETARLIPDSRLRMFEGRGHVTIGRDPGFKQELEQFAGGGAR